MNEKKIGVIGAGAWGTGLAQALARGGNKVILWAREQEVVDSINNEHENKLFLPNPLTKGVFLYIILNCANMAYFKKIKAKFTICSSKSGKQSAKKW